MKILRLGLRKELYRIVNLEDKKSIIQLFVNVKFKIINNKNNKEIIFLDFGQKNIDFSLAKIPTNISEYNFTLSENKENISFLKEVTIKDLITLSIDEENKLNVNYNENLLKDLSYKITYNIEYYKVVESGEELETIKISENEFRDIFEKYQFSEENKKENINTFFFTY